MKKILSILLAITLSVGNTFVMAEEEPVETDEPVEKILEDEANQNVFDEEECKEETNLEIEDVIETSEDSNDQKNNIDITSNENLNDFIDLDTIDIPLLNSNYGVDINSYGYLHYENPYSSPQCTWYCWGRAYEKLGITLPRWGNANDWDEKAIGLFEVGYEARENSIMVENYYDGPDPVGHVMFVERVENGIAYITDGNYKSQKYHEDEVYLDTMRKRDTGKMHDDVKYIYLTSSEKRGTEMTQGYNRVLPDGDYMIVSAANPKYYLDISEGRYPAKDGDNVSLCGSNNYNIDYFDAWTIKYSDGFYRISQYGKSVSLDVEGGDTLCGKNVQAWSNNDSSAQKWAISEFWNNGSMYGYRIQSKCSSYSLDIYGGNITGGANINQWESNTSDAQRWLFIPYKPEQTIQDGSYIIVSANDTNCQLDVDGNSLNNADGTNVQIWRDDTEYWHTNANSQYNVFDVKHVENGYYRFELKGSGTSLDVNISNGYGLVDANIQIWANNNNIQQLWAITRQGNGYLLRPKSSGYAMDVENGLMKDGTNIRQHGWNGSLAQTWYFVPAEYPITYMDNYTDTVFGAQTKSYKGYLNLLDTKPTRSGYAINWNTKADGTGTTYQPGQKILEDKELTLYAQWESVRSLGDVTGEGDIDVSDIIKIRDIILGEANTISTLSEDDRKMADVNADGNVDVSDIILVRDRILGVVDEEYKKKS